VRDRDRIRWDDSDSEPGTGAAPGCGDHEENDWAGDDVVRPPSSRVNRVTALVMLAVFLATVVLCCVAAREAGQLLWPEPPPP
jgi:hypothetical protein